MELRFRNSIGLLGYIIIVNEEIHSRQIKWLNIVLKQQEIDNESDLIKDILDDKDDKPSYNDCLNSFQQESLQTKELIYRICFQLAIIDNDNKASYDVDSQEETILKNIEYYIDKINVRYQRKQAKKSIDKKLLYVQNENDVNSFDLDFDAILKVASDDYDKYECTFNRIFSECNTLITRLENKLEFTKLPLLKSTLENFLNEYKQNVNSALSDIKASSLKKELSAHNFSIALMGRTKAGKSTLHYIMCNEGREFIGKGSQRTTRFNRVFSWNKLKIIDTPGIGAGEEQGKKDEEIALRVLSQADMICFVLIDDTIQNDVLELLDKIAEYHKPMLIVLNHKEDIRKKSHLKTFLSDPDNWRLTKGESNLAGYINRLNRNAAKNNYDKLIKVVPVFLLAAQIGKENNDAQMFKASNFPSFVEAIQSLVEENCLIYKSQTMLDEPSIRLHKAYDFFEIEQSKLLTLQKKVKCIRERIDDNIRVSKRSILFESERSIATEFDDFYTAKSYMYVEENYKEKSIINLNKSYNLYLAEYGVKDHINDILSDYLSVYQKKISEIVGEIDEELNYAKLNIDSLFGNNRASIKGNKGTFSFKNIFKAVSMILDTLSIYWPILSLISIPVSILGNLFKSKQDKIDDAKTLTLDNFKKLSDYSKNQVIKKTKEILEKVFRDDQNEISAFFDALEEQLDEIINFTSRCREEFNKGIKSIDVFLANRILQYIMTTPQNLTVIDAKRNLDNNTFTIIVKRPRFRVDFDTKKYQNISTEKVIIRYID